MKASYDLAGIVEHALRREVMSWRTYDRLSQIVEDGPALNMILQLVGFEVDHVKTFTEVLRPQIDAAGIDVDAIVKAAESDPIDMGGFIDEEKLAKSSLSELLKAAALFETAMEVYYKEAAARTEDATIRAIFEDLAAQESSHETFISDMVGSLELNPTDDADEFGAQ